MLKLVLTLFGDGSSGLRRRVLGLSIFLILANLGAWLWALVAFRDHPVLLGTALLAYSFGLRHAVDADHIAAIDNVTRKLMQEGKRPAAVGPVLLPRSFHHRRAGLGRHRGDGVCLQA